MFSFFSLAIAQPSATKRLDFGMKPSLYILNKVSCQN